LIKEKCLACHGQQPDKPKAAYDLRTRDAAFRGGESGVPAIVPNQPENSPLYLAVTRRHDDWSPMPPKENDRLSAEQIGWIKEWIAGGAPWPDQHKLAELVERKGAWSAEEGITVATVGALTAESGATTEDRR
jgi:mono/diheme cytochrome c family protein